MCLATPFSIRGVLNPEEFGAKGDGINDDTQAIQQAIDSLVKMGGGTVHLGTGTFMISSLRLGPKVSFVGNGNGATVIKQTRGQKQHCLIVKNNAAALKIANLVLVGENENSGIFFEESGGNGENHHYLYSNTSKWNMSQAYKWITIDNVCVYRFNTGLDINKWGFNINICNSTFSHNNNGVLMICTDSFMYNCYITNNRKYGLVVVGTNDKISNVKSIFNGKADAKGYGAIVIKGKRCQIINCETQDNYGKGFVVEGIYNLFSNCISNTDGYSRDSFQYDPVVEACGFMIKGLYNTFSNCVVTNYNEKYGAVYHSPVIVDESVSYYYPDILNDIKVLIDKDRLVFHQPFSNVQTLCSKNHVDKLNIGTIDERNYFFSRKENENVIKMANVHISSLQLLVDFRIIGEAGSLIKIEGDKTLNLSINQLKIVLSWQGEKVAEMNLDKDAVLSKDDLRLVVAFTQYQEKRYVSMLMYEKTINRGWIKKEIRQETKIPAWEIQNATLKIGNGQVPVKRLVVSPSPFSESVFLPSSNTNKIYDSAIVYVDADSNI